MKMNLNTMKFYYLALSLATMAHFSISALVKLTLTSRGIYDLGPEIKFGTWKIENGDLVVTVNVIGKKYQYFTSPTGEGKSMAQGEPTVLAPAREIAQDAEGSRYIYYYVR